MDRSGTREPCTWRHRRRLQATVLLLGIMLCVLAAGSAAGRAPDSRLLDTAQAHLSALFIIRRWTEFAYHLSAANDRCQSQLGPAEDHPDGSSTQSFTNSDCSRGVLTVYQTQRRYKVETELPNGTHETLTARGSDVSPEGLTQRFDIDQKN